MSNQTPYYQDKLTYETDSADLYSSIQEGMKVQVIDARKPEAFAAEHIPGSINIWHVNMNAESTQGLDPSCLYITYCDGIGCNASTKGALRMSELGFQVKELLGGLDWWKRDGYETTGTKVRSPSAPSCGC